MDCLILGSHKEKELLSVVESSEDLVDLDNYFLPAIFAARLRAASKQAAGDWCFQCCGWDFCGHPPSLLL